MEFYSGRAGERNIGGSYESWRVGRPQWSFHLPDSTSRFIVGAFVVFLTVLAIGYVGSVHRSKVAVAYRVVLDASYDTVNFIYSNMILPVLAISFVLGLIFWAYWYQKYRHKQHTERRKRVFQMVDHIIAILRKHRADEIKAGREGDRENCLPVPHVRDMLISPSERNSMIPIWEEAKNYINDNESRVQCETQFVGGLNCMVWRWVQPHGTDYDEEKQWQGHAFSEDQLQLNAPIAPYSECLKLRGMFDPALETEEDWPDHIQDALLEKLRGIGVMHMAVDRASKEGCVYMKLGTKAEAGRAFTLLHGSWFNGRLVSVKYLRSERYKERFPDAMRAAYPLEVKKPRHSLLI